MNPISAVESLLTGAKVKDTDPKLYNAIMQIAKTLYDLQNQVNPPTAASGAITASGTVEVELEAVSNFMAQVYNNIVRLTWDRLELGNEIPLYEVRLGTDWDTAQHVVTTANTSADIDPIVFAFEDGTSYTFLIKCLEADGTYGPLASSTINVTAIGTTVITTQIISNFVLLTWDIPVSDFTIKSYKVYRNGVFFGNVDATFKTIFEIVGGTITYAVKAVDFIGNEGPTGPEVSVIVTAPPDYIQQARQVSTFSGTKTNCKLDADPTKLIAPINTSETYDDHFTNNSWATPAAQVAAGYPLVIEPSETTAEYQEVFDFGSIFDAVIVNIAYNQEVFDGSVSVNAEIEVSDDDITYDTPVAGNSRYAISCRYARVTLTFTPSPSDTSIINIFNLVCALDVHLEEDGGTVAVLAADAGGTVVAFNKTFKAVTSITLTVLSTTVKIATYDFAFPVDPTDFKILVFNAAGTRQDADVSWKARGII